MKYKFRHLIQKSFFIFYTLLFSLLFVNLSAEADVVYLKNGQVFSGKIVAMNEQSLVIRTGQGESEVKVTVFHSDINRIESEEEFTDKTAKIDPTLFLKRDFKIQVKKTPFSPQASMDVSQSIQNLLKEDRLLEAEDRYYEDFLTDYASWRPQEEQKVPPADAPEEEIKQWIRGAYRPLSEEERIRQELSNVQKGDGFVSGYVHLPEHEQKKRGNLYIYLVREIKPKLYSTGARMQYQMIPDVESSHGAVYFRIEEVPPGRYKVRAVWDITPPWIQMKSYGEYSRLNYMGFKGDYAGGTRDVVVLREGEALEDVSFGCSRFLKSSIERKMPPYKIWGLEIGDLYYRIGPSGKPRFYVLFNNAGKSMISMVSFDFFVNRERIFSYPIEFSYIPPGKTKEFDVTFVYEEYLANSKDDLRRLGFNRFTFRMLHPTTKEEWLERPTTIFRKK